VEHDFEVQVYLGNLDPNSVRVELYAEAVKGEAPVSHEMHRDEKIEGGAGNYVYHAAVPMTRPALDFAARILPRHDCVAVPLEASEIF
jgi:glycogen phosphorylase